jgi:hypothetical protein
VIPYPSIFTLHYRHQHHLALTPGSNHTSGRPRRSLDTNVPLATLFTTLAHHDRSSIQNTTISTFNPTLLRNRASSRHRRPTSSDRTSPSIPTHKAYPPASPHRHTPTQYTTTVEDPQHRAPSFRLSYAHIRFSVHPQLSILPLCQTFNTGVSALQDEHRLHHISPDTPPTRHFAQRAIQLASQTRHLQHISPNAQYN